MEKSQYLRKHDAFLQPHCFTVEQFTVDTGNGHIYTSQHLPQFTNDTKGSSVFLFLNIKTHFSYTVYLHTSRLQTNFLRNKMISFSFSEIGSPVVQAGLDLTCRKGRPEF